MQTTLLDHWWVPMVRGVVAVLFGVLVLMWPGLSLIALIALLAAYWIIDGAASIFFAAKAKNWGWPFWGGVVSLIAGALSLLQPGVATISILIVIAIWAIARGVIDIYTAIKFRREIDFEWWLGLGGVASIAFGLLVLARPGAGALAIATLLGAFAIALGVLLIISGFRIRAFRNKRRPMGI